MMVAMRGLLRLALVAALGIVAPCAGVAAERIVLIKYRPYSSAAETCAEELRASVGRLGGAGLKVVLDTSDAAPPPSLMLHLDLHDEPSYYGGLGLVGVPFALRDPAHFQAFLKSGLYNELRGHRAVAMAYGGFYHLFSAKVAMTEPKHFFERFVGGARHSWLYRKLKAIPSLGAAYGLIETDAALMAKDDTAMAAVDAPLIEAQRYQLDQRAKFVNLTFTAAYPVMISLKDENRLSAVTLQRVMQWLDIAAQACGARNFDAEQKMLETLKAARLTIVPVNRTAFVEAGWTHGLTGVNLASTIRWTIADFDRLVQLGEGAKPKRLPSALLATLTPKERADFLGYSKAAEGERRKNGASAQASGAILKVWYDGLAELVDAVRDADPPAAQVSAARARPPAEMSMSDAQARLKDVERRIGNKNTFCDGSGCLAHVQDWCAAARTFWRAGDKAAAERIFAYVEFVTQRRDFPDLVPLNVLDEHLLLLRTRVTLKDPAAPAALAKAMDLFPIPEERYSGSDQLRADKPRYLASIALLYKQLGDETGMSTAFGRATDLAVDAGSAERASVAEAYWMAGQSKAAWALAAQALEVADPATLFATFDAIDPLNGRFAAMAAKLLERVSELERPFGLKGTYLSSVDDSDAVKGWRGDWLSHLAWSAQLWNIAGERDEISRIRDKARQAAGKTPSLKFQEINQETDDLLTRGRNPRRSRYVPYLGEAG